MALAGEYADIAYAPKPFVAGASPVPVSGKVVGGPELRNLIDSSLDLWLTTGRFNDAFEKRLAEFIGVRYALTVNSGSSANLAATSALCSPMLRDKALKPGDEVITCATGFPTTVNPIAPERPGAGVRRRRPRRPTTSTLGPLEAAISAAHPRDHARPHARQPVRPGRESCGFAEKHDLWLIEDCCDALGATLRRPARRHVRRHRDRQLLPRAPHHHGRGRRGADRRAGDSSASSSRSATGAATAGARPARTTPAASASSGSSATCRSGYDHKYIYSHLGYNLKITDMQAAVGLAQFDRAGRLHRGPAPQLRRLRRGPAPTSRIG